MTTYETTPNNKKNKLNMKIRELLTDESKWTQGASARNKDLSSISPFSKDAKCFCLSGAGYACYGSEWMSTDARKKLLAELENDHITWNDHLSRTFAEVKALVEKLDI